MSSYRKPKRKCPYTGKLSYPSQLAAENAAIVYRMRLGSGGRPYVCPHCGHWHLTTKYSNYNRGNTWTTGS